MPANNYPTVAEIEQVKKDMQDIHTFVHSTQDYFTDSNGVVRKTMKGIENTQNNV